MWWKQPAHAWSFSRHVLQAQTDEGFRCLKLPAGLRCWGVVRADRVDFTTQASASCVGRGREVLWCAPGVEEEERGLQAVDRPLVSTTSLLGSRIYRPARI